MSMDEARLSEIERDVTDALKSYEGFPYPTNGMRAIVTTAIPDMATEIRRCWQRITELEEALRDIQQGANGNAGNCMDCDSIAQSAQRALEAQP